jgi:predicted amidophosphoribosyltransferase
VLLADLVDLVLPRHCIGCGEPGVPLCARCGAPDPVTVELGGLTVTAAAPYDGGLRAALIAYKERGRRDLARPLRALLATALPAGGGVVLVPVPSSTTARRARGGDHVRRLVRGAVPALELARDVLDSAGLDAAARATNLAAAMRARPPGTRAGPPSSSTTS